MLRMYHPWNANFLCPSTDRSIDRNVLCRHWVNSSLPNATGETCYEKSVYKLTPLCSSLPSLSPSFSLLFPLSLSSSSSSLPSQHSGWYDARASSSGPGSRGCGIYFNWWPCASWHQACGGKVDSLVGFLELPVHLLVGCGPGYWWIQLYWWDPTLSQAHTSTIRCAEWHLTAEKCCIYGHFCL